MRSETAAQVTPAALHHPPPLSSVAVAVVSVRRFV